MESPTNNQNSWYIIDLSGKVLGRPASEIAKILIGKNSPDYSPENDSKNAVIAINASKIVLTGNKINSKRYYKHTGYLGNLKTVEFKEMMEKSPEKIVTVAVAGMLPKNLLRDKRISRLKVYANDEHPHVNVKAKKIL